MRSFFKEKVLKPAIAFATGFVFSGFNPVVGAATAISTVITNTGEGRQFVSRFGKEFFDDALGMRPGTARIWSGIVTNTALTLALEATISNVLYPRGKPVPFDKNNPQDMAMLQDPKGKYPFGRYPSESGADAFEYDKLQTLTVDEQRMAVIGIDKKQGGLTRMGVKVRHSGAIADNFPLQGIQDVSVLGLKDKFIYGTLFGTCHQATNQTFLNAGLANTVWDQGWEFKTSTLIYGNYGGGTAEKTYWGTQYDQND